MIDPILAKEIELTGIIPDHVRKLFPKAHFCPNWNDMFLADGDPEMECCNCYETISEH